jgi:hypothetical protein
MQLRTLGAINSFTQVRLLGNNVIEIPLTPLRVPVDGTMGYKVWRSSLILILRQHGVYEAVDSELHPLSPGHELHLLYEHMIDTACALIWNSLSEEVKKDRYVRYYLDTKQPLKALMLLARSFGDDGCEFIDGRVPTGLEKFGT